MKRFWCLCLYKPFRWLEYGATTMANWAYQPLYRENNRLHERRSPVTSTGEQTK